MRQAYATGRINQISIPPVLLGEVGGAPGAGAGPLPSGRQQAMQKCLCFAPACSLVALRLECKKPEEEPLQSGSFWIALGTRASEHATASLGQHHPLRGAPLKSLRRRGRAPPCYAPISGSPLWFFSEAALELYKDPWKGLLHLRRPRCLDQNTPCRRKVRGAGGRECHTPAPLGLCKSLVLALVPIGWQYERPAHRLRPRVWASFRQGQVPVGR